MWRLRGLNMGQGHLGAFVTLIIIVALALTMGCGDKPRHSNIGPNENRPTEASAPQGVESLLDWMTGNFDSSEQANSNPAYYAVQLRMCPVQAPELGSNILYVEQAMMSALDTPYRQRLYRLDVGSMGLYVSEVYSLTDPDSAVGLCDNNSLARVFELYEYEIKPGCAVFLEKSGEQFTGGTDGKECMSSINGASYATSLVTVFADRIESWDRGFDVSDNQVWGAEAGAYIFKRQSTTPGNSTEEPPSGRQTNEEEVVAGETCQDAPNLRTESTRNPEGSDYSYVVSAQFGETNDYNPYIESELAPGCSLVYDSRGKDVVFQVTLSPGETLFTRLALSQYRIASIYLLDDCEALTWPDVDESGMCGRAEYHSNGFCGDVGCDPLEWSFQWPTSIAGLATQAQSFFVVIDEVRLDTASGFTLEWSIE